MSLEQDLIKRYTSSKKIKEGYYLRIRKENGKINIKIYYHGIKMMELSNGNLIINTAIFVPNGSNVFEGNKLIERYQKIPSAVKTDMQKIEQYFTFSIGSQAKGESVKGKKLDIHFSTGTLTQTKEELMNIVVEKLRKTKMISYFTDIMLSKNRTKILLFLRKTEYSLEELYDLMIPLLEVTLINTELQKVEIDVKSKRKVENIDLDEIESILKNRIQVYIQKDLNRMNDYRNSKSETNQEKQKQQDFMVLLNKETKEDIFYQTKEGKKALLYSNNTMPFELEYIIYAGKNGKGVAEIEKRAQTNIKGRIDNVVVDGNVIHLVEIKHGTGVIAGTNGIHKHLIDLFSCLNISQDVIFEELQERIKIRNEVLSGKEKNMVLDKKFYYDIVCIYDKKPSKQELSKEAVKQKLHEIMDKNAFDKTVVKCNIDKTKITSVKAEKNNHANQYSKELLEKNVGELCDMLKSKNCIVRILLVDNEFQNFLEYDGK